MSDRLIIKPVTRQDARRLFLDACKRVLDTGRFIHPVAGVVVTVAYEDGTVSSAAAGLSPKDARRALDVANEALNDPRFH